MKKLAFAALLLSLASVEAFEESPIEQFHTAPIEVDLSDSPVIAYNELSEQEVDLLNKGEIESIVLHLDAGDELPLQFALDKDADSLLRDEEAAIKFVAITPFFLCLTNDEPLYSVDGETWQSDSELLEETLELVTNDNNDLHALSYLQKTHKPQRPFPRERK